jgi:hypothetical protein
MWCTCLWRHDAYARAVWCLWCMSAWLSYPQNEIAIESTITSWEGVCVASRILTTKIPSALLVAIMWLQRTWCPRFRHGTFSYGITTSPTQRIEWEILKHSMRMHVSSPKVPKCTCYANACSRRDIIIYLFIFKRLWARPWGMSSWLHVRNNQDKDIKYEEYPSASTCLRTRGWREIQVDEDNKLVEEITIGDWIIRSRHSHWHSRIA